MAPRVMAPCGFLADHLSCVGLGALTETEDEYRARDVSECRALIECNNNDIVGEDDKCSVLLPHHLYQSIDYSINISTSPPLQYNQTPAHLYASVLPKSKRLLSSNSALESRQDRVKPPVDIDVDDNSKWNMKNVDLPRETQDTAESSGDHPGPHLSDWRQTSETGQTRGLSSNSGASKQPPGSGGDDYQITAQHSQTSRYQREFEKHEQLLINLSVLHKVESAKKKKNSKFQLPPVCGRSPPCDCPEDQLYAAKLRIRILKKISTLRQRHIRLRVMSEIIVALIMTTNHLTDDLMFGQERRGEGRHINLIIASIEAEI